MKLRLPVVVERTLAEARALQIQSGFEYEHAIRQQGTHLSCSKGCAHCCYHPFLISIAEGVLLYRALKDKGLWTASLQKQVQATRNKTLGLAFEVWLLSNIPCPLLVNNECSAYEMRPLHCRTTFSTGDPAKCHPHEIDGGTLMLDNTQAIIEHHTKLRASFKRISVTAPLMPLAEAVLIGEAIDMGDCAIEATASRYIKDMTDA